MGEKAKQTMNEHRITFYNVTGKKIGDEGAMVLSERLKTNTTMTSLDLWSEEKEKEKEN